jgi:hypothetical protein
MHRLIILLTIGLWVTTRAYSAVIYTQDFDSGIDDWFTSGQGTVTTATNLTVSFALQAIFTPETRIWGVDLDLSAQSPYTIASFTFNFFFDVILPGGFLISFGNDTITAEQSIVPVLGLNTVFMSGWNVTGGNFSDLLQNITYVDILIDRSGAGAQSFSIDDFTINSLDAPDPGGGGGDGVIPEPTTVSLMFLVLLVSVVFRRRGLIPRAA